MSDRNDRKNDAPHPSSTAAPSAVPSRLSGVILDEQHMLTLTEFSHACAVQTGYIIELVDEGLLVPENPSREQEPHAWRFTGTQMRRARTAVRLQNDLGINLAGVALALQLLDEMEALRAQLDTLARLAGE